MCVCVYFVLLKLVMCVYFVLLKLVILNVFSHFSQICHVQNVVYLTLEGCLLDTQEICFEGGFCALLGWRRGRLRGGSPKNVREVPQIPHALKSPVCYPSRMSLMHACRMLQGILLGRGQVAKEKKPTQHAGALYVYWVLVIYI